MAASNQSSQSQSRSGYFIRNRLLQATNKAVASASAFVSSKIANGEEEEDYDGRTRAATPSLYTEERCLVFPGFAYVRNDQLNISIEGFAFRLRPLGSASRTQKLFVSAVRQLTSLPSLPKTTSRPPSLYEEPLDIQVSPEELKRQAKEYEELIKSEQVPGQEHANPHIQAMGHSNIAQTLLPHRSDTMSSIASTASTSSFSSSSVTTMSESAVPFSNATLDILHENLQTRLRLFFSQKLVGRRIRVSVYLLPSSLDPGSTSETCIAKGTLITEAGGIFKSSLSVPWKAGDPVNRKLRVRTELLGEHDEETIDDQDSLEAVMNRSDEASVGLSHAHARIRVVSDIDDTIKVTHVLAGIKTIMRNVFTRPHDELVVPGMQEWYWELYEKGVSFHYLSNSPYEIFGVLRDYLSTTGFPPGSIRLKDYGGGSSLLGGLWESASSRKRGGAEEILKTFPESRFFLVGDSGEQDLELYTSLACQYPDRVLAIFIRDVTTPLPRPRQENNTDQASSTANQDNPPSGRPLVRRRSDLEQQKLLESLAREEEEAGFFSSSTLAQSYPADSLDDADEFSPNNPLDRNLPSMGVLSPYDDDGFTEIERRIVSLFKDRVHRAKSQLPKHVTLKIFRTGDTCVESSVKMLESSPGTDERKDHVV